MVRTENTRRESGRARQAYRVAQARQHGWALAALPLAATIAERLRVKAGSDDAAGDRAQDALEAMGARQ